MIFICQCCVYSLLSCILVVQLSLSLEILSNESSENSLTFESIIFIHSTSKSSSHLITPILNGNTSPQINLMVSILSLLDILSMQEFCVPAVVVSDYFLGSELMIGTEIHISDIVGISLLLISTMWSLETLEYYSDLQKTYFQLLIYTLSSTSGLLLVSQQNVTLVKLFQSIGMNEEQTLKSLNQIYSTLIWGITSIFPSTPKLALQGIQHCALVGIRSNGSHDSYYELLTQFLWHCQESFTLLIGNQFDSSKHGYDSPSSPSTSSTPSIGQEENDLKSQSKTSFSWDRVDSFSTTFLSVIAFDVER